MSKFDDFVNTAKKVAKGAAKETVKLTDITATKVKIKAKEARLCDRYEQLGKAAEEYLKEKDKLPENISSSLDEIYKVMAKIAELKSELDEKKLKYTEAKSADGEKDNSSDSNEA
ncbi:MAG: hypothetical protein U0M06_05400 [Clostridia bacterium]|nr:hypothetical protein [Clostridia bacterium]